MAQASVEIVDFYDGPISGYVDAGTLGRFAFHLLAAARNLDGRLFALHPMRGGAIFLAVGARALTRPQSWIALSPDTQSDLEKRPKNAPMDPLTKWADILREASGGLSCLYRRDRDVVWLAVDRDDYVGAFATAGEGPIPDAALIVDPEGEIEFDVVELPESSDCRVILPLPRDDAYVDLARRGMFAYDWDAIDRKSKPVANAYDLVATPTRPIHVKSLTESIRQAAEAFVYPGRFAELRSVPALPDWVGPPA